MDDTNIDINTVIDDQDDSDGEETEDLPSDVADAIGVRKKKKERPDPTDYISEFENPDFDAEEDL